MSQNGPSISALETDLCFYKKRRKERRKKEKGKERKRGGKERTAEKKGGHCKREGRTVWKVCSGDS